MERIVDRPPRAGQRNHPLDLAHCWLRSLTWAAFAEVDEITRGDGRVIPASKTQIVQASEPGVVQEIAVKIGQTVRKGDLILSLENSTNAHRSANWKPRRAP